MQRIVELVDAEFQLRWTDEELDENDPAVAAVLAIPGSRWSKLAKAWVVPVTELNAVRRFAFEFKLTLSPDVLSLKLPKMRDSGLSVKDGQLFIAFTYDDRLERAVLRIPGISFDSKSKRWVCPTSSIVEAVLFAEHYGVPCPTDLRELARFYQSRNKRPSDR